MLPNIIAWAYDGRSVRSFSEYNYIITKSALQAAISSKFTNQVEMRSAFQANTLVDIQVENQKG